MGKALITINDKSYRALYDNLPENSKHNGLYYYAQTFEKYIIPNVKTDRDWNTVGLAQCGGFDREIVIIHNNLDPRKSYCYLNRYNDVICISNVRKSADDVLQFGHSIYMPPCVSVKEVRQFKKGIKKDQDSCFAGNPWEAYREEIERLVPAWVHRFGTMPREELLPIVAHYRNCYAIGCTAAEARALGCNILKRSDKYDPEDFPLLDVSDAVKCIEKALDIISKQKVNAVVDCTQLDEFKNRKIQ